MTDLTVGGVPNWGTMEVSRNENGLLLNLKLEHEDKAEEFVIRYRPFRFIESLRRAIDSQDEAETFRFKEEDFLGNVGYVWAVGFLELTLSIHPPYIFYWYGRDKREKWEEFLTLLKSLPVPEPA